MPNPKPLIAAAFICEKVLREENNVLSAIRIVDTYKAVLRKFDGGKANTVNEGRAQTVSEGKPLPSQVLDATKGFINLNALVVIRAGDLKEGRHEVTLSVRNPAGQETKLPHSPFPVNFAMDDPAESAQFTIGFVMPSNQPAGLHWIDVKWDGELLTSIPLKLQRDEDQNDSA